MARAIRVDKAAGAVVYECGVCGSEQTVSAADAATAGEQLEVTCSCGAVTSVPFNDFSADASPDVSAEVWNHLYRLRGDAPTEDPLVRLVELPADLGGRLMLEGEHPALPDDAVAEARERKLELERRSLSLGAA